MADNTDEEHFYAPPDTQPENPPDEIILTNDTEIFPGIIPTNLGISIFIYFVYLFGRTGF
jgi:hypothetical protein